MKSSTDQHQNAVAQLNAVAKVLRPTYTDAKKFDAAIKKLAEPDRVLETELKIKLDSGKTETLVDISSLKAGYYTCVIKTGVVNISKPFVKQ